MLKRTNIQKIIRKVFEQSLNDRLANLEIDINSKDKDILIQNVSVDLEESCHLASIRNFGSVNRQSDGSIDISNANPDDLIPERHSFNTYIIYVSQFIVHISPHFYSARHSFVFRDLLLQNNLRQANGLIPDEFNIVLQRKDYLWPEMYDNPYLESQDIQIIMETREVEAAMVYMALNNMFNTDKSALNDIEAPSFETEFSKAQQTVCMNKGNECWNRKSKEVVIECGENDAYCPLRTDLGRSTPGKPGLTGYCMNYEKFLMLFAKNNMRGRVRAPNDAVRLNDGAIAKLRKVWWKELTMARVYLDITR